LTQREQLKRCFLAIKVPDLVQIKDKLRNYSETFNVKIKIVEPINYHFTLHFFGDLDDTQIERIDFQLRNLKFSPFELELFGTGIIPKNKPKRARVLYIDTFTGTDALENLVKSVRKLIKQAGFQIPQKQFLPHLTVARIKYGRDIDKLVENWMELKNTSFQTFQCDRIHLIKSTLTRQGPNYNIIHSYP
jgi:2'-5' RNA ligase